MKLIVHYKNGNTVTHPDLTMIDFYHNKYNEKLNMVRYDSKYSVENVIPRTEIEHIEWVEIRLSSLEETK